MARLWTPSDAPSQLSLLRWVEDRMPSMTFDASRALPVAVLHDGKIGAVIVYHMRRGAMIEAVVAADTPSWATKGIIAELMALPFVSLGCQRITAIVRADNARSRKLTSGVGFIYEGTLRAAFPGSDGIVYGFTAGDWLESRWFALYQERHPAQEAA